jgi:hypothetical protein
VIRTLAAVIAAIALELGVATRVTAQERPQGYPEYRLDAIVASGTSVHAGAASVSPLGAYLRLGVGAAAGATWTDGSTRASGRVDVIARYLLDPYHEVPLGLSLGGGVTVPYADGDTRIRPYLTIVIDVEGRRRGNWAPAFQLGLGGGARIGLVVRRWNTAWR